MHILLTVLGKKLVETRYTFPGREDRLAFLAPIALCDWEKPDRVMAICTPEAKDSTFPILVEELAGTEIAVEPVDVETGEKAEAIQDFLRKVTSAIPPGPEVELTVDVTHGFRHYAFLTYVAVLYLAALRDIRVRSAYYGMLGPEESPFLDLGPLLELPAWTYALEVLGDTGSTLPLARLLERRRPGAARPVAKGLREAGEAYASGLPLEFGRRVDLLRRNGSRFVDELRDRGTPLASEIVERLMSDLQPFALSSDPDSAEWKSSASLTVEELARQAGMIDALLEHEHLSAAVGLLTEWVISWTIFRTGDPRGWLDYKAERMAAGQRLGTLGAMVQNPVFKPRMSQEQRHLAGFWGNLAGVRNALHHHGMRKGDTLDSNLRGQLKAVSRDWQDLKRIPEWPEEDPGSAPVDLLLVSPIGNKPGVLFSALLAVEAQFGISPQECLLICSAQSRPLILEALAEAGYEGTWNALEIGDPYGGIESIPDLLSASLQHVARARKIVVNLTGGTTVMGLVVQSIADEAESYSVPRFRFGLVDRRSPKEQDGDPYLAGEAFWLDEPGE